MEADLLDADKQTSRATERLPERETPLASCLFSTFRVKLREINSSSTLWFYAFSFLGAQGSK